MFTVACVVGLEAVGADEAVVFEGCVSTFFANFVRFPF